MLPRRPERLKSFDYIGPYAYFLTLCTDQRHNAFVDPDRVEVVSAQILRAAVGEQFALTAYCYMPDHLHLLVTGEQGSSDCRSFIARSKQFSGFYYQKQRRPLHRRESSRASLTNDVRQYAFLGSAVYFVDEILDALPWEPSKYRSREGSG